MRLPPAPNWPHLIRTIEANGINRITLARRLRVGASTVHRWALAESKPSFTHGCQLLMVAGLEAPRTPEPLSQPALEPVAPRPPAPRK
jgi:hypothetical protein